LSTVNGEPLEFAPLDNFDNRCSHNASAQLSSRVTGMTAFEASMVSINQAIPGTTDFTGDALDACVLQLAAAAVEYTITTPAELLSAQESGTVQQATDGVTIVTNTTDIPTFHGLKLIGFVMHREASTRAAAHFLAVVDTG